MYIYCLKYSNKVKRIRNERGEILDKWIFISLLVGTIYHCKIVQFPAIIYKFSEIPIKTLARFVTGI